MHADEGIGGIELDR